MTATRRRVLLSWSSGKDSAWTLHVLRQQPGVEVAGLLTSYDEADQRVAMHGTPRTLVEAQAAAAGLPVRPVLLPRPCPNVEYERRMREVLERARADGVTHLAFGDLYLEDIREYRATMLRGTGIEPLFPIWCAPDSTPALARRMLREGLRGVLTCVDNQQLSPGFAGRLYDSRFLSELPPEVDPCGERGEFHTFCFAGPMFRTGIPVRVDKTVSRERFTYTYLLPK